MKFSYEELDALIQANKSAKAKEILSQVNRKQIPDSQLSRYAEVARRVGTPDLALRALQPKVREEVGGKPSADELAEYGASLNRIGANSEAAVLLHQAKAMSSKNADLFLAGYFMSLWDYGSAADKLNDHLYNHELCDYELAVTLTNQLACFVALKQFDEAQKVISTLDGLHRENSFELLRKNRLLLEAQLHFGENDIKSAKSCLEKTQSYSKGSTLSDLYLEKWKCLVELKSSPTNQNIEKLQRVLKQAEDKKHWETVRDIHAWQATFGKKENQFLKCYFGTPYPKYRESLIRRYQPGSIPGYYDVAGEGDTPETTFDLIKGKSLDGELEISQNLLLKSFQSLFKDFFKPINVGSLFADLFPGEHFDPFTSKDRVYQKIKRLNQWIDENSLPLLVHQQSTGYLPKLTGSLAIRVYPFNEKRSPAGKDLRELEAVFVGEYFTSKDAQEVLRKSPASISKLLKMGMEQNVLESFKEGKSNLFYFKKYRET